MYTVSCGKRQQPKIALALFDNKLLLKRCRIIGITAVFYLSLRKNWRCLDLAF